MYFEAFWNFVKNCIPEKKDKIGRPRCDDKKALAGIFFIMENGAKWRNLPKEFGTKSTVHRKFTFWRRQGIFEAILQKINVLEDDRKAEYKLFIDAVSVKAPLMSKKHSGRNPTDRGKQGIKRLVITDRKNKLHAVTVFPANIHDSQLYETVIKKLKFRNTKKVKLRIICADSAFDVKKLRKISLKHGLILLASTNKRRKKDAPIYHPKERWRSEQSHAHLNNYRGLKICWNKLAEAYEAFVQFASAITTFKRLAFLG